MASGSFNKEFTNYSTKYKLIVDWSSAATVSTNSSVVTCVIKLYCPYGLNIAARTGNIITINGTNYTYNSPAINTDGGTTHTLATVKSNAIKHNADGSKSVTITCNFNFNATLSGTKYGVITASKTVTLDKIAQKAIITAAPNFNDEQNPTITYSNGAGNSVTALDACISFDGANDNIAYRAISKTGTSYTFNFTDAERAVLRNFAKNSNSVTVHFFIRTTIGTTNYYSIMSKTLTIVNAAPKLSPVAKDVGSVSTTLTGNENIIIKNYNVLSVSQSAVAQKGATIVSEKITCGSKSINSGSGTLSYVDSGDIVFSATDSRGNTTTQTLKKTLINYVDLTCNLKAGAPTADGKMNFTISGNCFNGSFGAKSNVITVQYRYKKESGSYSSWTAATPTFSGNTYNAAVALTGLDYQSTYTFQARVIDSITNKESAERKVKTTPVFDWGADDFKFNVDVSIKNNVIGSQRVIKDNINEWAQASQYYTFTGNDRLPLQLTGYILVWSHYENSTTYNYCTNYTFIPKCAVGFHNGRIIFTLVHDTGAVGFKTLTITDDGTKTVITGNDANKTTANSGWVLNRIIAY